MDGNAGRRSSLRNRGGDDQLRSLLDKLQQQEAHLKKAHGRITALQSELNNVKAELNKCVQIRDELLQTAKKQSETLEIEKQNVVNAMRLLEKASDMLKLEKDRADWLDLSLMVVTMERDQLNLLFEEWLILNIRE